MAENFLVRMTLNEQSTAIFRYDLDEAPESFSHFYTPGVELRPEKLLILLHPDPEGVWYVRILSVFGHEIVNGVVKQRKRLDSISIIEPLKDRADLLPEWLKEIAEHHVLLMNDGSPELRERQREAARKAAREMFSLASEDMADDMADAIFIAIRRVG